MVDRAAMYETPLPGEGGGTSWIRLWLGFFGMATGWASLVEG